MLMINVHEINPLRYLDYMLGKQSSPDITVIHIRALRSFSCKKMFLHTLFTGAEHVSTGATINFKAKVILAHLCASLTKYKIVVHFKSEGTRNCLENIYRIIYTVIVNTSQNCIGFWKDDSVSRLTTAGLKKKEKQQIA